MVMLPLMLAGIMLAWNRLVRRKHGHSRQPVDPRWLLVVAAIGIWSHPLLDLLNTYGVRLLMPFSGHWFYGDTLFFVDPWLWGSLAVGIVLSRIRRRRAVFRPELPTRVAIAALTLYIAAMAVSSQAGRGIVDRQASGGGHGWTMVAPVPVTPFRRAVVRDLGTFYETGTVTWRPRVRYDARDRVGSGRTA